MATIELDDTLYAQLEAQARQKQVPTAMFVQQILQQTFDNTQTERGEASALNWAAFNEKLPELLQTHPNQYVALVAGEIVAFGDDRIALLTQLRQQYGRVHILVTRVTQSLRVWHIPYRRTVR